MTTSVLCAHLKSNLKEDLVKIGNQYAVVNLCKEFGLQQPRSLMVVDFIQLTIESSGIL
jgi:hypothetical protein